MGAYMHLGYRGELVVSFSYSTYTNGLPIQPVRHEGLEPPTKRVETARSVH